MESRNYEAWMRSIKERVQRARFKALMSANAEQVLLYWDVGGPQGGVPGHEGMVDA